jgi:hypothetical protein
MSENNRREDGQDPNPVAPEASSAKAPIQWQSFSVSDPLDRPQARTLISSMRVILP